VGAKGSPRAHFQRAVERGNVVAALAAAAQLEDVGLADALALCALLAEKDVQRFDRAAARWHARYVLELPAVTLAESQLVLASVTSLATGRPEASREALVNLAATRCNALQRRGAIVNLRETGAAAV
jgi:hypothetical protein